MLSKHLTLAARLLNRQAPRISSGSSLHRTTAALQAKSILPLAQNYQSYSFSSSQVAQSEQIEEDEQNEV